MLLGGNRTLKSFLLAWRAGDSQATGSSESLALAGSLGKSLNCNLVIYKDNSYASSRSNFSCWKQLSIKVINKSEIMLTD